MGGNFKFQVQDSFWNIFFRRLGDLKDESHFLKKTTFTKLKCLCLRQSLNTKNNQRCIIWQLSQQIAQVLRLNLSVLQQSCKKLQKPLCNHYNGLGNMYITMSLVNSWTSLYMDGTASKIFLVICPHEAGTWDPNYAPGVDFLDHNFLSSKNSG